MPVGMAFMFVALWLLRHCTRCYTGAAPHCRGARFGALIGVFAIGSFVVHNYVNLQIGAKLSVQQGASYFA